MFLSAPAQIALDQPSNMPAPRAALLLRSQFRTAQQRPLNGNPMRGGRHFAMSGSVYQTLQAGIHIARDQDHA
jgi:hypothetical protein